MTGYDGPGLYRHYKGGEYEVLGLAIHEANRGFSIVIYRPVGSENVAPGAEFWARSLTSFNDYAHRPPSRPQEHDHVPRFEKVGPREETG